MLRTNNLTIFLGCYHLRHHLQNHHVTGTLFVVLRCTNAVKGGTGLETVTSSYLSIYCNNTNSAL